MTITRDISLEKLNQRTKCIEPNDFKLSDYEPSDELPAAKSTPLKTSTTDCFWSKNIKPQDLEKLQTILQHLIHWRPAFFTLSKKNGFKSVDMMKIISSQTVKATSETKQQSSH